ncbi:MAG TPA: hypothetical protein VHV30_05880 [Polyangiaceae bacterium]|jgi:hypothetical protein|nr:hypothetical protein [Polyangiaceae bacterium]
MRRESRAGALKTAKVTAAALAVATAGIGALHMPFARPLVMKLGGCPMAGVKMDVETSEKARAIAAAAEHGAAPAPARPALGFALDATTLADARAWAQRSNLDCDEPRPGLLACTDVPAAALGEAGAERVKDLELQFSQEGRLVNMTTWRDHMSPERASTTARAIVASLGAALGPGDANGAFDAAHLAAPPAHSMSSVSYRFRDYVAEVTAMNAPSGGPSVREHYMSARD